MRDERFDDDDDERFAETKQRISWITSVDKRSIL